MQGIRAALGNNVHNSAGIIAVLRGVVAGLNAELFECVGKWKGHVDGIKHVAISGAIQRVINLILLRAAGRYCDLAGKLLGNALQGPSTAGWCRRSAGDQHSQCRGVSTVERQFYDLRLVDDLVERRRCRVNQDCTGLNIDRLGC